MSGSLFSDVVNVSYKIQEMLHFFHKYIEMLHVHSKIVPLMCAAMSLQFIEKAEVEEEDEEDEEEELSEKEDDLEKLHVDDAKDFSSPIVSLEKLVIDEELDEGDESGRPPVPATALVDENTTVSQFLDSFKHKAHVLSMHLLPPGKNPPALSPVHV